MGDEDVTMKLAGREVRVTVMQNPIALSHYSIMWTHGSTMTNNIFDVAGLARYFKNLNTKKNKDTEPLRKITSTMVVEKEQLGFESTHIAVDLFPRTMDVFL